MPSKKKQGRIKTFIEFLKVQVAGNALFWVTYLSFFAFDKFAHIPYPVNFIMATITGNIVFFLIDRHWIYNEENHQRKTSREITRFIIFMVVNFFIVQCLNDYFGISPYIGQFVAGAFFTVWTFLGLHFWVFQPDHTRYSSIRYQRKSKNGRKQTKQKTA